MSLHEQYPLWATEQEVAERRRAEWGPRDWSYYETPSIPADDPIFTEGVIITMPIVARCEGDDDE